MGLDINFNIAKRSRLEETEERLSELNEAINAEYRKSENEFSSERANKLSNEYDEINPWKEIAYFRKVNFLLPFFGYEENCSDIEIDKCQIEDLVDACKAVLEDHSKAEELLPTTDGFFFGSTEYDDWYFGDVECVKTTFENILEDFDPEEDIIMMHCWW